MSHHELQSTTQAAPGDQKKFSGGDSHPVDEQPDRIGRYRIERLLGKGGFGRVYLAHDEQLDRFVAVKVPHAKHIARPEDAEPYLNEARILASLDHPHLVPVHDIGQSVEYPCYIVSKYVDGCDLSVVMRERSLTHGAAAELVALVAEALHYAHKKGLVHRDVKPANILIDRHGKPHIVDFGLALREENVGQGPRFVGTPTYMSPEQARSEGHRVDGRTDIYSLGAVFYELLSGRRKTSGLGRVELLEQILEQDPKPLRQIDDAIPRELERICLKSLSRRVSDRYTTALDMAEDLWHFLGGRSTNSGISNSGASPDQNQHKTPISTLKAESAGLDTQPIRVVPKGLRSFDAHDADFFLELLPGPRDRNGLPDSLRFWKTWVEHTEPDQMFSVGMIYGPSGCGKSSFMKAGLLPLLSDDVTLIYVEATPDETESRLLNGLRKHFPALNNQPNLNAVLGELRREGKVPFARKVLIVLDQFEQWLHGNCQKEHTDLVEGLRQSDGCRIQCIVLVRDDFWMAATRFMHDLEVPLRESVNSTAVDLFPFSHAEKVLTAFGRAFGALPEDPSRVTAEQQEFVTQSVASLAEDGRVICVRLALYAEMIKGKTWTPGTLEEIGGASGVGVAFLEETFSVKSAPLENRYHQKAARAILKALLPPSGTDIKGQLKSFDELLIASGYASRQSEFNDLIRILDTEIRLITPTDPEGLEAVDELVALRADKKYYQLSHDYLIHSLREWLTRKQKETRRGRAELQLAEYAANWNAKPGNRRLPTLWDYLGIRLLTCSRSWTSTERRMMLAAGRMQGIRWGTVSLLLLTCGLIVRSYLVSQRTLLAAHRDESQRQQAKLRVDAVLTAPAEALPYAIENLQRFRLPATPMLEQIFNETSTDPTHRLRAAAVLADFGDVRSSFLIDSIASAPSDECNTIVQAVNHAPQMNTMIEAARRAGENQNWPLKSRCAIILLYLGDATVAREMSELVSDPTQRVIFIDTIARWHSSIPRLVAAAEESGSGSLRSAICLGIGKIPPDRLPYGEIRTVVQTISNWYATRSDSGTHGATNWMLKQWHQSLPELVPTAISQPGHEWYLNSLGMTMVRIPARMDDPSPSSTEAIETSARSFWLCDREVTRRLFQQFVDDPDCPAIAKPADWSGATVARSPTLDHPVQQVNWVDAVRFCNWASSKERLRPCYRHEGSGFELDVEADGYRLPTEAEWERACRAGAQTDFVSGDATLLEAYAVYESNQTSPCGTKMPNGWGLFDMHGNVYEWCQNQLLESEPVAKPAGKRPSNRPVDTRVLRSGAFDYSPRFVRASEQGKASVRYRSYTIGFRPARSD